MAQIQKSRLQNFSGGEFVEPSDGAIADLGAPNGGKRRQAFLDDEIPFMADNMISLTGSPPTGKWIATAPSEALKRVHLELGGKAPVVAFDDADLEVALGTIAGTGYHNAGQDCTAATRVLTGMGVYDEVVAGLAAEAQGLVVGDTMSADTTLGALNSVQRERVEGFLQRKPPHAEVLTGGGESDLPGFFLGYKESGYGKDLSMYSLEDYTHVKHVMASLG